MAKRVSEAAARAKVDAFLLAELGAVPEYHIIHDGDDGWAFWILNGDGNEDGDTTSYVHADGMLEWLGTQWDPNTAKETP